MRHPLPNPEELRVHYSHPAYFSKVCHPQEPLYGYNNYLTDRHLYMWLAAQRMDEIELLQPRGRLLDVGCATGVLLDAARLRGWQVQGVDVSSFAVRIARAYYNLDVIEGELHDAAFPSNHFDVVTMDDVVEHAPDPRALLTEAARVLRPAGLLSISTPNAASLSARLMRGWWFHYKQREHLTFFTPRSANILLDELGLRVLSIRRSPRFVDLRYLFTRLGYYLPRLSHLVLRTGRHLSFTHVGFFIYTGEMTVRARKRSCE
jgi:2-polyprenyl-3-methyl-5-hydroxy-6-metoxy-1,4-benzoquinol methylase